MYIKINKKNLLLIRECLSGFLLYKQKDLLSNTNKTTKILSNVINKRKLMPTQKSQRVKVSMKYENIARRDVSRTIFNCL